MRINLQNLAKRLEKGQAKEEAIELFRRIREGESLEEILRISPGQDPYEIVDTLEYSPIFPEVLKKVYQDIPLVKEYFSLVKRKKINLQIEGPSGIYGTLDGDEIRLNSKEYNGFLYQDPNEFKVYFGRYTITKDHFEEADEGFSSSNPEEVRKEFKFAMEAVKFFERVSIQRN